MWGVLANVAGPLAELDKLLRAHEGILQGVGVRVQGWGETLQTAVLGQQLQPVPAVRLILCPLLELGWGFEGLAGAG